MNRFEPNYEEEYSIPLTPGYLSFLLTMVKGTLQSTSEFAFANSNKASQAIQSPRTVPFFLLVSLLDGYSFPNVLVKGIVAFKH